MSWTYRIVDHGQHFALHTVKIGEDGRTLDWVKKSIDFAVDRDCGPQGIIKSLEEALAEARRHPVIRAVSGELVTAAE